MTELLDRLEKIELSVKFLQSKNKQLEEENQELKNKLSEYKRIIGEKEDLIINLQEQNKIAKLAEGLTQDQDRDEVKAQLDSLIKEIDQCIKLVKK